MIRITTLIENSPGEHLALKNEHGISFCIEKDGHKILFDTGQSDGFIQNAAKLKISLSDTEFVVLSHGHYDHSGGLVSLAQITSGFELVTGKGFFIDKYAWMNNRYEYIGNNFDESFLDEKKIRWDELSGKTRELVPGVFVLGSFPRKHDDEIINPRFKQLTTGGFIPDSFNDEIMVVVDTPKGLIAVLGCSHPGMKNMLDEAKSRFNRNMYAVLGGTHLVEADAKGTDVSLSYLAGGEFEIIGVSHCTGSKAMNILEKNESRYFHNRTGSSLIVL